MPGKTRAKKFKTPMRKCMGCQEMKGKKELIRVVRSPEDEISLDASGRKNGRGAYICPDPTCLEKAIKSKGLERSLKMRIPDEVMETLKKELMTVDER